MEELKKCPFCGGNNVGVWHNTPISPIVADRYEVRCYDCHIGTPVLTNKKKAIEAWNTRKPMERIVERLEKHYKEAYRNAEKYKGKNAFGMYLAFKDAIKIVKEETDHEESDIISGTTSGS